MPRLCQLNPWRLYITNFNCLDYIIPPYSSSCPSPNLLFSSVWTIFYVFVFVFILYSVCFIIYWVSVKYGSICRDYIYCSTLSQAKKLGVWKNRKSNKSGMHVDVSHSLVSLIHNAFKFQTNQQLLLPPDFSDV